MTKNELINAIVAKTGLSKKAATEGLEATMEIITETLLAGDKVQLVGFGTFETKTRSARTGHNPATGEPVEIAAARLPQFKAGKALKDAVNQ